jgi:hypothetical protein
MLLCVGLLPIRIPYFCIEFHARHFHRFVVFRTYPMIGIVLGVVDDAVSVRFAKLVL